MKFFFCNSSQNLNFMYNCKKISDLRLSMATRITNTKKRVAISYTNLTPELLDAFKQQYPLGYTDKMIRIDKPNGDFFYAVVLDTPDTTYLVKVNVKIDSNPQEDLEKDLYEGDQVEEIKNTEDVVDMSSESDD